MRALAWRIGAAPLSLAVLAFAGLVSAAEYKKRREPPSPAPLVVGAVRYEAPVHGQPFGYQQDGGILVARDAVSGELHWTRRVYRVERDPSMEGDKQDVFIKRLDLSADRRRLLIVNEHGKSFELNLDGGRLRALR
jgi:hypothetical protein